VSEVQAVELFIFFLFPVAIILAYSALLSIARSVDSLAQSLDKLARNDPAEESLLAIAKEIRSELRTIAHRVTIATRTEKEKEEDEEWEEAEETYEAIGFLEERRKRNPNKG